MKLGLFNIALGANFPFIQKAAFEELYSWEIMLMVLFKGSTTGVDVLGYTVYFTF